MLWVENNDVSNATQQPYVSECDYVGDSVANVILLAILLANETALLTIRFVNRFT